MAIKLELEIKEAELVLAGVYKLPMEIAEPLVAKIKGQALPQVQEQSTPVEVTPAEPLPEEPIV